MASLLSSVGGERGLFDRKNGILPIFLSVLMDLIRESVTGPKEWSDNMLSLKD